jgi:glucose/mannose-6-phosphate isomerase
VSVLDDLKLIHQRDGKDALGIAEKQWKQYLHNFEFSWSPPRNIENVVVAGMGGSGLAATAAKVWPGLNVPFEIVHDYSLPSWVDEKTLVICSSYSGNTEETLACLKQAIDQTGDDSPMLIVVASGGVLIESAKDKKLPYVQLPEGFQPRMTFGYQLRALIEIFIQAKLLDDLCVRELESAANKLEGDIKQWLPAVKTTDNFAKELALELAGKSAVIYSGPLLSPAAYKWKISINENAKNIAWYNELPEFNHNEFLGWTSHPGHKPYAVVDLRSDKENERIQKRFDVSQKLLSGKRPAPLVVDAAGNSLAEQLLWTVALGDFVSLYLAILNGLDPTPVDIIERLKSELKK